MIIYMNEYDKKLGMTRTVGIIKMAGEIREQILELLKENDQITIDFSGVESISSSFATELLLKLYAKLGKKKFKQRIKLENVNEFNKIVVRDILSI